MTKTFMLHFSIVTRCEAPGLPCKNGGFCINKKGVQMCLCANGYTGTYCESKITKCVKDVCQNGATCKDLYPGYKCICMTGYYGTFCEKKDRCSSDPCKNSATCENQVNGFKCTCVKGFTGKRCEININDCKPGSCLNGEI